MTRPLIVSDCDGVLLDFVDPFVAYLAAEHELSLTLTSFALSGNIRRADGSTVESAAFPGLLKGFFDTLPNELLEAARLDGASELTTLRVIMLPLSRPVVAVTTYFAFTGAWNDFLGPWIMLMSEQGKWPLSVVLYKLQNFLTSWQPTQGSMDPAAQQLIAAGVGYNALMALSIIESIPMFLAFLLFREQLMKGIQLSGLKG